jgi:hypothetical protein
LDSSISFNVTGDTEITSVDNRVGGDSQDTDIGDTIDVSLGGNDAIDVSNNLPEETNFENTTEARESFKHFSLSLFGSPSMKLSFK